MTEFAAAIAAGESEVALVFGSDAISTERYFAERDDKPDFSESLTVSWRTAATGTSISIDKYTVSHGLFGAPVQYGLMENARRARLGLGVAEYRQRMGELFAPFTNVAAKNPFSASPVERSVEELITVTDSNRMICDP